MEINTQEIQVKLIDWLKGGFNLYKENFLLIFLSTIIFGLLSFISYGVLAGPLAVGIMQILFRLLQKSSPAPGVTDIFQGFSNFKASFLFVIVAAVISWLGSFILGYVPVIGGLLSMAFSTGLGTLLIFSIPIIADKKLDFWAAMELSIETVKPKFFLYVIFSIVSSVIVLSGTLLIFIGVFLTAPMYLCPLAVAYKDTIGITTVN